MAERHGTCVRHGQSVRRLISFCLAVLSYFCFSVSHAGSNAAVPCPVGISPQLAAAPPVEETPVPPRSHHVAASLEHGRAPVRPERRLYDPDGAGKEASRGASQAGAARALAASSVANPGITNPIGTKSSSRPRGAVAVTQRSASSVATPQRIAQVPASSGVVPAAATSAAPAAISTVGPKSVSKPTKSLKLIDERMRFCEPSKALFRELPTNFLVVGVLGHQGVGKSMLMSLLHEPTVLEGSGTGGSGRVFATQTEQYTENSLHMTCGIDVAATAERVILLDSQPMLSASLLDKLFKMEPSLGSCSCYEDLHELQALQLAVYMLAVCDVVILAQDWFPNQPLWDFVQTAEQLRPVTLRSADPSVPASGRADLLFVYNRAPASACVAMVGSTFGGAPVMCVPHEAPATAPLEPDFNLYASRFREHVGDLPW